MRLRTWILLLLVVGCAGRDPYRKIPPEERQFIEAVDIFLEAEEIQAYRDAETDLARRQLAEAYGVQEKYDKLSEDERAAIARGDALVGMSKDAVFMAMGPPLRIRKQFESSIEDYVEVYQYRFERTRRGDVFVSPANSRSAYKNEVFERHVEFVDGQVRAVLEIDVP